MTFQIPGLDTRTTELCESRGKVGYILGFFCDTSQCPAITAIAYLSKASIWIKAETFTTHRKNVDTFFLLF